MIHYASFGRRAWAFALSLLVDLLMLGLLWMLTSGNVAVAFAFWYLLHHIGFVVEGGTIGHRLAGLRVVRDDGSRIGVGRAARREVARLALSIPPLGLGMLWMLDEPQRRTWHDLIGHTVVVRETELAAVAAPEWAAAPPWREDLTAAPAGSPPSASPHPLGD